MSTIHVMICQNDDNGNLTDQAYAFDFSKADGERFLYLETVDMLTGRTCLCNDPNARIIEIFGVRVKHSGKSMWAGNMKWNLYYVPLDYALGLINTLMRSKQFSFNEGWTEIYKKWNIGLPITGANLDEEEYRRYCR